MIETHRGYARAFQSHFQRLWNRDLSHDEVAMTRTLTLCESFMGLEAWERHLASATTVMTPIGCTRT